MIEGSTGGDRDFARSTLTRCARASRGLDRQTRLRPPDGARRRARRPGGRVGVRVPFTPIPTCDPPAPGCIPQRADPATFYGGGAEAIPTIDTRGSRHRLGKKGRVHSPRTDAIVPSQSRSGTVPAHYLKNVHRVCTVSIRCGLEDSCPMERTGTHHQTGKMGSRTFPSETWRQWRVHAAAAARGSRMQAGTLITAPGTARNGS